MQDKAEMPHPSKLDDAQDGIKVAEESELSSSKAATRICERCNTSYTVCVPKGGTLNECKFHCGRLRMRGTGPSKERYHTCCEQELSSKGCATGPHVFKETDQQSLHKRIPYTCLGTSNSEDILSIIAIDCEMSYTTEGLELVRVTVLNGRGDVVIDELVRPLQPIVDFNTRWSGIRNLDAATNDIYSIKEKLKQFANEETIILGHGVENDLHALRVTLLLTVANS
jgi:RNA exonuclease 1